MILVVLAASWKHICYDYIFLLAGLLAIPRVAARSGGGRRRRAAAPLLRHRPAAARADGVLPGGHEFRLRLLRDLRDHRAVTRGGPAGATNMLVYKVYQDGFVNLDLGSSAAQSVMLMMFALAMTLLQFRYRRAARQLRHLRVRHGRTHPRPRRRLPRDPDRRRGAGLRAALLRVRRRLADAVAKCSRCRCRGCRATTSSTTSQTAWTKADFGRLFVNSFIVALGITVGKIAVSLLSAFAITYFRFPFRMTAFWLIFVSLMLPVEVRISPTYESVANAALPLQWLVDALHVASLSATGRPHGRASSSSGTWSTPIRA